MSVLDLIKTDIKKIMYNDPAHDFDHIMRVYKNAQQIIKKEKVNETLVLSAVLFYNLDDPFCKKRMPDDKTWTLDHFFEKLLKLEFLMNTKSGKIEAKKRTKILKDFLKQLKHEI